MGAGNVKAKQPLQPPLLRLPPETNVLGKQATTTSLKPIEHHLGSDVTKSPSSDSGSGSKKWSVTCNIHRSLICRFCGGKSCKREDWTKQEDTPAIRGLHSTWVSANVLGMQRPSTRLIKEFNIIEQFKKAGVGAVVNLQLSGEHPHCGDGIDAAGFSYRAEDFTDHMIHYYNPGWVDMDIPSLEKMIEIVQIMSFHSQKSQKIAVHCHAGYGRTGIVIACFFVYAYGLAPEVAIKSVRDRRKGSVQTTKQKQFVSDFYEYVTFLRTVYPKPIITPFAAKHSRALSAHAAGSANGQSAAIQGPTAGFGPNGELLDISSDDEFDDEFSEIDQQASTESSGAGPSRTGTAAGFPGLLFSRRNAAILSCITTERAAFDVSRYTLHEALSRQRAILHGEERNGLKFVPKILHILLERLLDWATHNPNLTAAAFMDGFRKTGSYNRAFDEEREREKERRKAKEARNKNMDFMSYSPAVMEAAKAAEANIPGVVPNSESPVQPRPSQSNDDGGLASLNAHGVLANHTHWDFASQSSRTQNNYVVGQSINYNSQVQGGGSVAGSALEKEDSVLSGPKWTLIQDDTLSDLKRSINAGEFVQLESCDIRYCAALLLEWIDTLKVPLLPLFERPANTAQTNAQSGVGASSPHQILQSPSSFFASLPRWTLHTLDPIMRLLYLMRNVPLQVLVRLYARFAFALAHPKAALPEQLCVFPSTYMRAQSVLTARAQSAGLTIQLLSQAAQAQLVQAQQTFSNPAANANAKAAAVAVLKGPPHNFDPVHYMLPPSRSLLDSLVEFLAAFTRQWTPSYTKLLRIEEREAVKHRIGVRKNEVIEVSRAQHRLNEAAEGGHTQLLPVYSDPAEATKLLTSQASRGDPQPFGVTRLHAPEQTQEHSALGDDLANSRAEISTTTYLHSRINHIQPRDPHGNQQFSIPQSRDVSHVHNTRGATTGTGGVIGDSSYEDLDRVENRRKMATSTVHSVLLSQSRRFNPDEAVDEANEGDYESKIAETSTYLPSRFDGNASMLAINKDGLERDDLASGGPISPNQDRQERLTGFLTARRLEKEALEGLSSVSNLSGSGTNNGASGSPVPLDDEPTANQRNPHELHINAAGAASSQQHQLLSASSSSSASGAVEPTSAPVVPHHSAPPEPSASSNTTTAATVVIKPKVILKVNPPIASTAAAAAASVESK